MKTNCLIKKLIKIKREIEISRDQAKFLDVKFSFNVNR